MYAHFFHDHLEYFADALGVAPPAEAGPVIAGTDLITGRALDRVLEAFAADHGITEPRAAATDWSKYFFARLIIPVVVVQASTGRQLTLAPEQWQAHCRDDGTIARFVFAADPLAGPCAAGDMAGLIDSLMAPMIAALAGRSGLSPRVFASNAAMYYAWALSQLAEQGRIASATLAPAHALLDSPTRPDGGWNPFHAAFKALPPGTLDGNGEPVRQCRRLCCVRDLDPGLALCANCPRAITWGRAG